MEDGVRQNFPGCCFTSGCFLQIVMRFLQHPVHPRDDGRRTLWLKRFDNIKNEDIVPYANNVIENSIKQYVHKKRVPLSILRLIANG